jgi:cyclophilin family peptidyl-prolyl cis-trans isomerase
MMKLLITAVVVGLTIGIAHAANPMVDIKTSQGDIVVELYPKKAPKTVENFLHYVNSGFYEGTVFHRVIKGFVVQGGGFDKNLKWRTPDEAPVRNEAKNGLTNEPGTIAMAHDRDPNSATSQFFFNMESNKHLNHYRDEAGYYGHAVFGKIVKGMDVVKRIADMPTGASGAFQADVPIEEVAIEKVALVPEEVGEPPSKKSKSKGKSNGKNKNQSRRHLAGT